MWLRAKNLPTCKDFWVLREKEWKASLLCWLGNVMSCGLLALPLSKSLIWLFSLAEIHHLVHEQDGTTVPGAATQPAAVDGVRQTRSTSKHKQRNHEATTQGTEYRYSLQATKKKSGHIEEAQRRHEEAEGVARRSGCEFLVIEWNQSEDLYIISTTLRIHRYFPLHRPLYKDCNTKEGGKLHHYNPIFGAILKFKYSKPYLNPLKNLHRSS